MKVSVIGAIGMPGRLAASGHNLVWMTCRAYMRDAGATAGPRPVVAEALDPEPVAGGLVDGGALLARREC